MASLEELKTRRRGLEKIKALGVRATQIGGERTEFRSDAELRSAIQYIDLEIERMSGGIIKRARIIPNKGV